MSPVATKAGRRHDLHSADTGVGESQARQNLLALLRDALTADASDVHLAPGYPATFRVHGKLQPASPDAMSLGQIAAYVDAMVPEKLRSPTGVERDLDFSLTIELDGRLRRFRASIFHAQGAQCVCLRCIPEEIPTLESLGFPEDVAQRLTSHAHGLVLVTGVTGAGKSSTLAALVHRIRQNGNHRILTIEEPVEYIHPPGPHGFVTQREVGTDVASFAAGLRHGLRHDPEVMLVGEIRDRETAQIAFSAAETGHLILSTLHTRDAKGAISRLIDLFPQESQEDMRKQLAMSLRSVVCQHLLPSREPGDRRVLALEVLHANAAVQAAIRSGRVETLDSAVQTGKRDGMVALDDSLRSLVAAGKIDSDEARRIARDPEALGSNRNGW